MTDTGKTLESSERRAAGGVSGAVLVLGAGISEIQSALDLANAGFKVYLVEKSPSIGGVMPQLDKTFPTNDCAMCILAPRLVDAGRHPNIEILCRSEITALEGTPGDFSVSLRTTSAWVDPEKCNGCGDCVERCPVSVPSPFDERIGRCKAIDRPFPQAIPNIFGITKEGTAPCRTGCPALANVQGYIALAAQGRWAESFRLVRRRIPFPGVLGRICHHPCENACNRKDVESPVAIREVKRFIADYYYDHPELEEEARRLREERERKNREEGADYRDPFTVDRERGKGRRVAVIGAGPAGLTAAADLAAMGYAVEVFEKEDRPGGMMQWVIPDFRLDKTYLQKEIRLLVEEFGFPVHYNKGLGCGVTLKSLAEAGFQAVFVATGAPVSKKMKLPGEDVKGVWPGLDFIRAVNRGEFSPDSLKGKRVAVLGAGNVAMDAARMAIRLGADVTVVYRRSRKEMPATEEEVAQAEEEGAALHLLTNPVEFIGEGGCLSAMKCIRMRLGEPDASGRRRPVPIEGSEFVMPCDLAVAAIGQDVDAAPLKSENLPMEWGLLKADPLTLQTEMPHVFAGGDMVTGPASVVEAIRAGHEVAVSVDRFLRGEDLREGRGVEPVLAATPSREHIVPESRAEMPRLPLRERRGSFVEVTGTLSLEECLREARRCLECGLCSECMECVAACGRGAVDHNLGDRQRTVRVGSMIIAPGYEKFLPPVGGSLGAGLYPNVLTSIQFERLLSASGPMAGHVARPSDHKTPRRIAWLQCVGSRDRSCDRPWCSSICCMAAVKEAVIAKEHLPGLETHIYYMDLRSFGKDFEKYVDRARDEHGVVFRPSRVPRVEQDPETGNLRVRYIAPDGSVAEEEYDMVVLSVGMQPCPELNSLADLVRLQLNEYGFIKTEPYEANRTSRPGVYAAGTVTEPKDIPESVTEASAAAACASEVIHSARNSEVTPRVYPEERDVAGEQPRIGVFVCHCGTNIGGVVDVAEIVRKARSWPHVAYATDSLYVCSQDAQVDMRDIIRRHGLNRVVVASCTPRTHEELFQDTVRDAGLNPNLFQMANIRDQCSWVHRDDPGAATKKAAELVRMAVSNAVGLYPVRCREVPLIPTALVIGAGIAGMTAALAVADQGYDVFLVEKEEQPGGYLRNILLGFEAENPDVLLRETVRRVSSHPRVTLMTGAELEEVSGYIGNFTSRVKIPGGEQEIRHGVIIVATGAKPWRPDDYLYGEDPRVVTQEELEKTLAAGLPGPDALREVVMIQCVGSREDRHPWCSRVCCSAAIRNALALKDAAPQARVVILYRDIRTFGFREDTLYRRARERGILFVRFDKDRPPRVVKTSDGLTVQVRDEVLGRDMVFHPDRVVLSAGMVPAENEKTARLLKVPLNADGFFLEAHAKLRPVDFAADGIFLCGTAHSPRFVTEAVTQARAAAARALQILSLPSLQTRGIIVQVNPRRCSGCEMCVSVCAYGAREFDPEKGYVTVNEVLCQGCGACAAACPNGSTTQNRFTARQICSMIDSLLVREDISEPLEAEPVPH